MSILKYLVKKVPLLEGMEIENSEGCEVNENNYSMDGQRQPSTPDDSLLTGSENDFCESISNNYGSGYCDRCGKNYYFLDSHVAFYHENMEEQRCAVCGLAFSKKSHLFKHLMTHTSSQVFCCFCLKTNFIDFEEMNVHLEDHEFLHIYNCELCDRTFSVKIHYEEHLITHENPWKLSVLKCLKCDMCFDPRRGGSALPKSERRGGFRALTDHWKSEHKKEKLKCSDCSKELSSFIVYYIHCLRHSDQLPLKCQHCGIGFRKECRLKEHINSTHLNICNFYCKECGLKFKYQSLYDEHVRTHDPTLQFSCNFCGKLFVRKQLLREHFIVKNCFVCKEEFYCKATFDKHFDSNHKNDKLFKCNACFKEYKKEFALKSHITKEHSENTLKLECNLCSFETGIKRNLLRHKRRNHTSSTKEKRKRKTVFTVKTEN